MRRPYSPEGARTRPGPGTGTLAVTALFVTALVAAVVPPAALAGAFLAASVAVAVHRATAGGRSGGRLCVSRTGVCV
jgi:hypothetical protein